MMKILKTIFGFIAGVLIIGGGITFAWQYFRNKQLFVILMNNSVVKGSLGVLQRMALSVLAVILGLIVLSTYLKISSYIRRKEREKEEALLAQQRENEELNRQLKKEAEEAKAETERVKKQNDLLKMTFIRNPETEEKEKTEETEKPADEPNGLW